MAPLVLLFAQTRSPEARGPVVGLVIDSASLVERALLWATGGVSDVLQEYVTSVASYDELVRLRRDNMSAATLRARIAELERENEVLRGLAHVAERIDGPRPLGARVIGRSGAPLTRILRIDRGSYDGIDRGDGVVTARGVLGRVLATGRHSSDVLLLTDPSAAVDVVSQRTRARGIVRGTGEETSYRARVEDFDRLADVRLGDALVTSGLGGKFPPGLLVGEVLDVALREDGLYQIADVKPAVDVARAEQVLVLVRRSSERMPRLAGVEDDPYRASPEAAPSGPTVPPGTTAPGAAAARPAGTAARAPRTGASPAAAAPPSGAPKPAVAPAATPPAVAPSPAASPSGTSSTGTSAPSPAAAPAGPPKPAAEPTEPAKPAEPEKPAEPAKPAATAPPPAPPAETEPAPSKKPAADQPPRAEGEPP